MPDASAARSTDSDARIVPDEFTTLSSGCSVVTIPLTDIAAGRPPDRGAGSLLFELHDERITEQPKTVRESTMRDSFAIVSSFWFFLKTGNSEWRV